MSAGLCPNPSPMTAICRATLIHRIKLDIKLNVVEEIQEALRQIERAERGRSRKRDSSPTPIFARLAALSRQITHFHADVLKSEGLSHSEYQLLSLAWSLGPQTPRELNKLLLLTSGALTTALDRLQAAGSIRRRPNPDDARSVLIHLTAPGTRRAKRLVAREAEAQTRALASFSPSERRRIVRMLDQLIEIF